MRADGPVQSEVFRLVGLDQSGLFQRIDARRVDGPPLTLGQGLIEVREVGEGAHEAHARCGEGVVELHVVVHALEVVDPRLEHRLAVQCAPEAGASQAVLCRAMMLRYPAAGSWQKTTCSWPIAYGSFSMVQRAVLGGGARR